MLVALCMVRPLAATEHDPLQDTNDSFGAATQLAPGILSVSDNLAGDVGRLDTRLGHFDPTYQNLKDSDDDGSDLGNGTASGLHNLEFENNGSLYLAVTGTDDLLFNMNHTQSGPYKVFVDVVDGQEVKLAEETFLNETLSGSDLDYLWIHPNPAYVGMYAHVNIDNIVGLGTGDAIDFWRFTDLDPGVSFTAEISSGLINSRLGFFDEWGLLLNSDDDGGEGLFSLLQGVVPENGEIVLGVTGSADEQFVGEHIETGSYTLIVTTAVPEPQTVVLFALGGLTCWMFRGRRRDEERVGS